MPSSWRCPLIAWPDRHTEHAAPAQPDDAFYALEASIASRHGETVSGFKLLDTNEEGLRWRLALIDSARHTIDAQHYLWYGDDSGLLLLERLLQAADRGVHVRLLIDDLNLLLRDASTIRLRDQGAALLASHPGIELRLFKPWSRRGLAARAGEALTDMSRLNQRMHHKMLVVDSRAAIVGGRNIGDEYFGLNEAFNFHGLDLLAIGPMSREGLGGVRQLLEPRVGPVRRGPRDRGQSSGRRTSPRESAGQTREER